MLTEVDTAKNCSNEESFLEQFIDRLIEMDPERIKKILNLHDQDMIRLVAHRLLHSKYAEDVSLSKNEMEKLLGLAGA